MHEIHIQQIHIRPIIGVYDFERLAPRDIYIDVRLTITRSGEGDEIGTTLDYDQVVAQIESIASTLQPLLLETLSEAMVEACLEFPSVTRVVLTMRKPGALKNGDVALVTTKEKPLAT